jgi:5,6-dimethylbenzimidazole synthase
MKPVLGIPAELSALDVMCFGPPDKPPYKRWRKTWLMSATGTGFDASHFMTDAQIDEWVATTHHKVTYRDAEKVD